MHTRPHGVAGSRRVPGGILVLALPLLLMGAGVASPQPGPTDEFRVGYGAIGSNRHPFDTSSSVDEHIAHVIFDPLFRQSADGQPEPVLVSRYEQVRDTRWRFTLKPNVRFHDGRPLTAADAKFSIESYGKPESTGLAWLYAGRIDHVDVIDDLTFEIVAMKPDRDLIAALSYLSYIIPSGAADPRAFSRHPVGTGPYRFVEFIPNDRVVVEANTAYWGRKPAFRRITFRQIAEDATRMAALKAGEIDFAANVPPEHLEGLRKAGLRVSAAPYNRVMFVRMNLLVDGPWQDVRVRQAMNYAVDRDAIRKALLGGYGENMKAPLPIRVPTANRKLKPYEHDPARARRLLAEAGYPRGFETTLATPKGRYIKDREVAEAVAGQLETVGIRLSIVPLEWATYVQQVRAEKETTGRKYGLSLMAWGNLPSDPIWGLNPFEAKNSWNLGGYSSAELEALIERARRTLDKTELQATLNRAQEIVWRDAPWIFLFELPMLEAFSPRLKGYTPRPDGEIYWNTVRFDK